MFLVLAREYRVAWSIGGDITTTTNLEGSFSFLFSGKEKGSTSGCVSVHVYSWKNASMRVRVFEVIQF
jgi:hypothetical protein